MTKDTAGPSGGAFHAVHAERDLQSNWEVDLAKKLEEYLLKICSGEITGEEEGNIHVNFAEGLVHLTLFFFSKFPILFICNCLFDVKSLN